MPCVAPDAFMRCFSSCIRASPCQPACASPHRRSPGRQRPAYWLPVLRSHRSCEAHMGAPPAKRQQQRPLQVWQTQLQRGGRIAEVGSKRRRPRRQPLPPLRAVLTLHVSNSLSDCAETPLPSLVRPFCWSSIDSGSKLTLETRAACRKAWASSMVSSEGVSPESFTVAAWLAGRRLLAVVAGPGDSCGSQVAASRRSETVTAKCENLCGRSIINTTLVFVFGSAVLPAWMRVTHPVPLYMG